MSGRETRWGPGRRAVVGLARGVAMGAADVVPGVSGGTIAVVLGIYERLVDAIRGASAAAGRLLRGDWRGCGQRLAAVDWWLVVPLLVGILLFGLVPGLIFDVTDPAVVGLLATGG